jgi:hypothetical protein
MRASGIVVLVALLILSGVVTLGISGGAAAASGSAAKPVVGNVTGPTVLAYGASSHYPIQASGGPAFASNGTQVGNLTYFVGIAGSNTTGVTISPATAVFKNGTATAPLLAVTSITQVLTLDVEITSVFEKQNVSLNLTYSVNVVQPYVLSLNLVSESPVTVAAFPLAVDLDGTPVGTINVPNMTSKESLVVKFQYATVGLASGEHTFTVSLANEHGLVLFAGGGSTYSVTFYVPGPPPDYTLWYVAGAVAFFGAIFIFVTRVAARRRAPNRR